TIGRAARNARGEVWLYADQVSEAMARAIAETNRRRAIQEAYNREHGIVPQTVRKEVRAVIRPEGYEEATLEEGLPAEDLKERIAELELAMWQAAESLDFERAARLRDELRALEARLQGLRTPEPVPGKKRRRRRP
ncbi:MAG: UvrB/UvrC motif-containing protein, partial [Thermus sp.]|uniref:UvrB/UvrC motif-containing protein n=1 Tax=Thermus sp. TaxID=275 RepID=UPI00351B3094